MTVHVPVVLQVVRGTDRTSAVEVSRPAAARLVRAFGGQHVVRDLRTPEAHGVPVRFSSFEIDWKR